MGRPPDTTPLTLDGAHGEGGGQIVRTALALAVTLRRAVTLTNIRARRPKPGLQPQHLTVVRALAAIGDAEVTGDALGSMALSFAPRAIRPGDYRFDVGAERGSAGAVSLLCQALVLPLALARAPSRLTLIGGTHAPWSPPVHYLTEVFFPALRLIGIEAALDLRRWGWYPAGGGEIHVTLTPARALTGFVCEVPAAGPAISGLSAVSRLPRSIAERQATAEAGRGAARRRGCSVRDRARGRRDGARSRHARLSFPARARGILRPRAARAPRRARRRPRRGRAAGLPRERRRRGRPPRRSARAVPGVGIEPVELHVPGALPAPQDRRVDRAAVPPRRDRARRGAARARGHHPRKGAAR